MSLVDRLRAAVRAFVLGPAVVEPHEMTWGHDDSDFSPPEYGEYLATSNGVYVCATLRADLLASLPLALFRVVRGEKRPVTSGSLARLLAKVNPFWTWSRLVTMTELSLCLWGEAFWFLERGRSGILEPRELWWARPDRVRVVPDPERYIKGFVYEPVTGAEPIAFEPGEVVWFRHPNPLDEFAGLSPLAAARLAADYASAAMKSNKKLFDQGMQLGGVVMPKGEPGRPRELTPVQAGELEEFFDRRFKGVDKAHRWAVLRFEAEVKALGVSPRDAEFLGGLKWALEDICRAYRVPLDLVGGQRTYENLDAAMRAVWVNAVLPEARWIAQELTEQLLPKFGGQADLVEFDSSGVAVLQEAEAARWARAKEQIEVGALTVNEWREETGREPVPWGGVWWAPATLAPVFGPDGGAASVSPEG